jgi:hypothetical protein
MHFCLYKILPRMDKILTKKITMFPHFLNQEIIPKTKKNKNKLLDSGWNTIS